MGISLGATLVSAQNLDVIKQRRETMRAVAAASAPNFKMMKGDLPFDLKAAQTNLQTMQEQLAKFKDLFPDNSKTGGDTDASPKIWTARNDFNTALEKMLAEVKNAAAAIKDEASLKTEYMKVAQACGTCHKSEDGFAPNLSVSFKKPKP